MLHDCVFGHVLHKVGLLEKKRLENTHIYFGVGFESFLARPAGEQHEDANPKGAAFLWDVFKDFHLLTPAMQGHFHVTAVQI